MKEIDLFVDRENLYRMFKDENGELYLGIMLGGIAFYEIKVKLTIYDIKEYNNIGKKYLNPLVLNIIKDPKLFKDRILK